MTTNLLNCVQSDTEQVLLENVVVTFPGGETLIGDAIVFDGIIEMGGFTAALSDCHVRWARYSA